MSEKTLTKEEEILKNHYRRFVESRPNEGWQTWESCVKEGTVEPITTAMKEHAKQEAIAFAGWMTKEFIIHRTGGNYFIPGKGIMTTAKLYNLFKSKP